MCVCVKCLTFPSFSMLLRVFGDIRRNNISFNVPNEGTRWFIVCLISFFILFYNETGSRGSGGLQTSSGWEDNTTFPITPWHKY